MIDPISFKSDMLWQLRRSLRERSFKELLTPVVRQGDDRTGLRATVELGGSKYLRSMIGPALRYNLQFHPRIFEIGPCFRTDDPDRTHSQEFAMLDLYVAGESYDFLFSLAEDLVRPFFGGEFTRLSIAECLRDTFGVDLVHAPVGASSEKMAKAVGLSKAAPLPEVFDKFIESELEPLSVGKAVFLYDFPLGGNEPCAKLQDGAAAILNRFELIIDGVEVVHGYEDETDGQAFVERAEQIGLYNVEQEIIQQEIAQGRVPARSVGLGIGIERLCMAATGIKDISVFRQSPSY